MLVVKNRPTNYHIDSVTLAESDCDTGDNHYVIANVDAEQVRRESKAAAHLKQLSRVSFANVDQQKAKLREQAMELLVTIDTLETPSQCAVVSQAFSSIKPQLHANSSIGDLSILVQTADNQREPANKGIHQQRRFLSTERRAAATRSAFVKPSYAERRQIKIDLLITNF